MSGRGINIPMFVESLRKGAVPTPDEISTYFAIPHVYQLRESLGDQDLDWVLRLAKNPASRNDTVSLLTGWATHPVVWKWALEEWKHATTYIWKQGLLWLLTENPEFDDRERRVAAGWLVSNLGAFLTTGARWWGKPEDRLARAISSLEHRGRPRRKAFVYLCIAMGASDNEGLRALLARYAADAVSDAVTADVAKRLLALLDTAAAPL
jgi:hypothetical protein